MQFIYKTFFFILFISASSYASAQELNILIVGQQGVGKTSLISTLYNLTLGRSIDSLECVAPIVEGDKIVRDCSVEEYMPFRGTQLSENINSATSQTSTVLKYTANYEDIIKVNFFDSPGFSSSNEPNSDDKQSNAEIAELISDVLQEEEIHLVLLVFRQGSSDRMCQQYTSMIEKLVIDCGLDKDTIVAHFVACVNGCGINSNIGGVKQLLEATPHMDSIKLARFENRPINFDMSRYQSEEGYRSLVEKSLLTRREMAKLSPEARQEKVMEKLSKDWKVNQGTRNAFQSFLEEAVSQDPINGALVKERKERLTKLRSLFSQLLSAKVEKSLIQTLLDNSSQRLQNLNDKKACLVKDSTCCKSQLKNEPEKISVKKTIRSTKNKKTGKICYKDTPFESAPWGLVETRTINRLRDHMSSGHAGRIALGVTEIVTSAPVIATQYFFLYKNDACHKCRARKSDHCEVYEDIMVEKANPEKAKLETRIRKLDEKLNEANNELRECEEGHSLNLQRVSDVTEQYQAALGSATLELQDWDEDNDIIRMKVKSLLRSIERSPGLSEFEFNQLTELLEQEIEKILVET